MDGMLCADMTADILAVGYCDIILFYLMNDLFYGI
jgi:hypothetical protein